MLQKNVPYTYQYRLNHHFLFYIYFDPYKYQINFLRINRTIRIVIDYILAPDNIEIIIVKQNDERVKFSIDQYKLILELKKGIASKFNIHILDLIFYMKENYLMIQNF